MTLQAKVVGWFLVFASLTVLLFGLGDYYQSTTALQFALEQRAQALAVQMAGEVEHAYVRAERELAGFGSAVVAGSPALDAPTFSRYSLVRVTRGDSLLREYRGTPRVTPRSCVLDDVRFDVSLPGNTSSDVRVAAVLPAIRFFADIPTASARLGEKGLVSVLRPDGTLVFDAGCSTFSGNGRSEIGAAVAARVRAEPPTEPNRAVTTELGDLGLSEDRDGSLALARSQDPDWVIAIGVDYAQFAGPFRSVRLRFGAIMGGILLIGMLFVAFGLRGEMRRLAGIAAAATEIGRGRFDVWLPPPTADEVGRVSLALGRMMERLRASLQQYEITRSLAAVGELATYLSHEVRNPLSSIRLNLQMLRRDMRAGTLPEDGEELVGLCLTELQRLEHVVTTVLDVGRPTRTHGPAACDAHLVVEETLHVMQGKLRAQGITALTHLHAAHSWVTMDAATLHSVLINLLLNSVDALRDSASKLIEVTTEVDSYDPNQPARFSLRVRDTGPGVPVAIRNRIFDPFFTTKSTGSGIGLPTALRAAQECGGSLYCTDPSDWKGGAEFVLELPSSLAPSKQSGLEVPAAEPLVGAGAA